MPGDKGQSVVLACKIRHLNLGPAKHEEVAIYAVNMRIPNVVELRELLCNGAIRWHSHVNMPGSNSQASKRDNVQKHK